MHRIALHHLETLVWIARLGTFRAAAERLNTTQPSISGRVRELEARTGIRLFRKEGRAMVLTVEGRDVVRRAEALLQAFESAFPAGDAIRGTVRVGSGEIPAAIFLPAYVVEMQALMPLVSIAIDIDLTADLLHGLATSRFDIIFLPGAAGGPDMRVSAIGSIDLVWVASPALAATIAAGERVADSDLPIWTLPPHSPLYHVMHDALPGLRSDRSVHRCNNAQSLLQIVAGGGGIAVTSRRLAEPGIASRMLAPVFVQDRLPSLPLHVAIRSRETDPITLRFFDKACRLNFL